MSANWSSFGLLVVASDRGAFNSSGSSSTGEVAAGQRPLFADYPDELLHFAVGACVLFTLLGVPGNFITIVALLRYTKVRNATAMFIINLSVSDLMFCCFNLPLATSLFYHRAWVHGEALCTLFPMMRYGLLAVSIFTVLAITLNRYIMIGHPRLYPKLYKRQHLMLMIALTWIGCFGSLVPTLLGQWGTFGLDKDIGSCSILPDAQRRSPKEFLFVVAFVLPCLAIVICYARIFFIVRKAAAVSHGGQQHGGQQQQHQHQSSPALKASASVRSKAGIGGVVPGEIRRGLMLSSSSSSSHSSSASYKKSLGGGGGPSVMEASFHLTCCESQQASGSTEISEETTDRSASSHSHLATGETANKRSGSILRWTKPAPVRIEVERGSEAAGPLAEFHQAPMSQDRRRISVSFMEPESDNGQHLLRSDGQYLRVPEISASGSCNRSSTSSSSQRSSSSVLPAASSSTDEEAVLSSPVHSDASSVGSSAAVALAPSIGESRSVIGSALSHVSGALHRRSTRNKSSFSARRHPGKMTAKDRKLLQMILVIFVSFIVCYMPITVVKSLSKEVDLGGAVNVLGYVLIYLTTCINPIIYVVMSSEYRQAYKNLLTCKQSGPSMGGVGAGAAMAAGPVPSRSFSQKAY